MSATVDDQGVGTRRRGPRRLLIGLGHAEAVTWALLLTGMVVKYGTAAVAQGELAVSVAGMAHGVVFLGYCLVVLLVRTDQRWPLGRLLAGLLSAVVPFLTVWFGRRVEARGQVEDRWRLRDDPPRTLPERVAAWLIRNPVAGLLAGLVAVGVLTGVALLVGPPAS